MSLKAVIRHLALLGALIVLATVTAFALPAVNQVVDQATLVTNQSGNYTWKTSAPSSNNSAINWTFFQTWVTTKACSVSVGSYVMTWGDVLACSGSHTSSAHTNTFSGTATGANTCNSTCIAGGGSPQAAQPFIFTFSAATISSGDPVTYTFTLAGTGCGAAWSITDGAGTSRASGTASASGATIIVGTAGTWDLTVNAQSSGIADLVCNVTGGSITSWY